MLDYVKPGRIVEIGPGGGVVLDLLEARFPSAEIIGVDLSREAIAALEARARAGNHRWRVVLGAAEALPELVAPRRRHRRVLLDPPRGLLVHRARREFQLASVRA